ncbi:dihydroorotase [Rikenella microfusus]|uniref:Dihydroorotase n=1 Tax=Rikenella microfusus TaxID=28139 RepID=A0A379MQV4_9BACT|nr:dihydroorotase [Rikenella microfusus]SUE33270.1 Dihydroorotase [Rikenella microfusus]
MILIDDALICNEGKSYRGWLTIDGERIGAIGEGECPAEIRDSAAEICEVRGALVMPGVIDDQVHFREPGLTEKAEISTESQAAAAGGVTSYMEMPNTRPPATTLELLEEKYARAAEVSVVNYSFYLGATNDNIAEIERIDPERICGVKVFMGSSTGNMLVDNENTLADIFRLSPALVATHCEDEATVRANLASARRAFGDNVPVAMHPVIRSAEACYRSTAHAVELAHKYGGRLHVLHLSTARELALFDSGKPLEEKRVTNEVCVHHLWFGEGDYADKGNFIKWNPSVKSAADRDSLRAAVRSGLADIVATDHAPHLLAEKQKPYLEAPSGGPLVQHSLPAMLTLAADGVFTVPQVVERMCHAPARLFRIRERGFLRPGYFADIAIVDLNSPWTVTRENDALGERILYKCGWSPFEGSTLSAKVRATFVNGRKVYAAETGVDTAVRGQRLVFDAGR